MRYGVAVAMLIGYACTGGGGQEGEGAAMRSAVQAAGVAGTSSVDAVVHTVDMVQNDDGEYRFVPEQLTIKAGDTVRWINVSGWPHNVQFRADEVPGGAADILNRAMAKRIGHLSGQLLVAPNAVYEISFANAPTGTYGYTCTPHELWGMDGSLIVQP